MPCELEELVLLALEFFEDLLRFEFPDAFGFAPRLRDNFFGLFFPA